MRKNKQKNNHVSPSEKPDGPSKSNKTHITTTTAKSEIIFINNRYRCNICNKELKSLATLAQHKKNMHENLKTCVHCHQ